jgi:hypothetical protein
MALQPGSADRPVSASLKATYRALLARGLEAGEAANLTAFLHGLPSAGFKWSLAEIDAIIQRRISHAAEVRAAAVASPAAATATATRTRRQVGAARRGNRSGSTHVIDPPAT